MLQNIVCSLELSIKLDQLGVKQESFFVWKKENGEYLIEYCPISICSKAQLINAKGNIYSAFTASELFELLPNSIDIKRNEPFNCFRLKLEKFIVYHDDIFQNAYSIKLVCDTKKIQDVDFIIFHSEWDKNISNALAKMLIYLIENNLINIIIYNINF